MDKRLRPLTYEDSEPALHAALAVYVSAWEAYIESLCIEILTTLYESSINTTKTIIYILKSEAEQEVKKFNTPNFENCRNLLLRFTGYDAYNDMQVMSLKLNSQQTQTRLNEILRVRHSFAHGLAIPNFSWLKKYEIESRLSRNSVDQSAQVIKGLATSIDNGAKKYLEATFKINPRW